MKIPEWVWLIVVIGLVVVGLESVRGCQGPATVVRDRIVPVPVTPPPVTGTVVDRPVYIRTPHATADTAEIHRLRDTIRTLTLRLAAMGASYAWAVDTVTPQRDTVRIECRTPSTIVWDVRPATRTHDVLLRDTVEIPSVRSRWGLGLSAGGVMTTSGQFAPGIGLGITYQIIP